MDPEVRKIVRNIAITAAFAVVFVTLLVTYV